MPTLGLGTVVILSTISRQVERRRLRSFGSTMRRNNGASVGSVVKAQMVSGGGIRLRRLFTRHSGQMRTLVSIFVLESRRLVHPT